MGELDCPFRTATRVLGQIGDKIPVVIVDFHAEATAEKVAMGWHLDGKVSAVVGTHTHVQTADARILPQGTAYITDLGMTGPIDSVIGIKKEVILERFHTQLPARFVVAGGPVVLGAAIIDIDPASGKAVGIERIWEVNDETK
jgi:metallophosphoesterase (TIGR00282 family)